MKVDTTNKGKVHEMTWVGVYINDKADMIFWVATLEAMLKSERLTDVGARIIQQLLVEANRQLQFLETEN